MIINVFFMCMRIHLTSENIFLVGERKKEKGAFNLTFAKKDIIKPQK